VSASRKVKKAMQVGDVGVWYSSIRAAQTDQNSALSA